MAAGLHVSGAKLAAFQEAFVAHANANIGEGDLLPQLSVDCDASLEELSLESVVQLGTLAPFGRDNPSIRLLLRGVTLVQPPQSMGIGGKHLSVTVRTAGAKPGRSSAPARGVQLGRAPAGVSRRGTIGCGDRAQGQHLERTQVGSRGSFATWRSVHNVPPASSHPARQPRGHLQSLGKVQDGRRA